MDGGFDAGRFSGDKAQVMDQVRQEIAMANAQELLSKMTSLCFEKCVPKPAGKLDSSEQACIAKCMDRYMEAWNVIARSYAARVQQER